ncbi:TonB-dependent receptor plug domain-containing protein [Ramlibacter sp. MMS24-I3-19]|uniref:TonB-dependent receptor plug domain-containing protein n=1 Tax=Ramlibacter sp. MMS24-I3-19 TaxID=3416606 RepID=UPI003CFC118B
MLAASVSSWAQGSPAPVVEQSLSPVVVKEKVEPAQGKDTLQTRRTNIGKGTQDLRDIPQSVTVLTEKLIDDARLDTLKEALHYTAGITFSAVRERHRPGHPHPRLPGGDHG